MSPDQAKELAATLRAPGLAANVAGDWIIFGGPAAKSGVHSLSIPASSAERVLTHWKGFVANNITAVMAQAERQIAVPAPRVRRMAVVTYWRKGDRALIEYIAKSERYARVWNVRGQRFNRSYTIDTLDRGEISPHYAQPQSGIKDLRPATLEDLKRFKFKLRPGQTLA